MSNQQSHEMQLEIEHASGAEEWYCPTCGRRFLLSMPPVYRKIILDTGDELAIHSGGKGGLGVGSLQVTEMEEVPLPEKIRAVLEKILKKSDIEGSSNINDSNL